MVYILVYSCRSLFKITSIDIKDGLLLHAITAELLGFDDYIPPYATASGQQILRGVNYASAAAGIRSETGRQLVLIISPNNILIKQIQLH